MFAFLLSPDSDVGGQVPDHKPDRGRGDKGQKAGGQVRGAGEDVRGETFLVIVFTRYNECPTLHNSIIMCDSRFKTASYNECVTVDL